MSVQCRTCGALFEKDDVKRKCIECEEETHESCAEKGGWVGNICPTCQQDRPVFFDAHSRTHGDETKGE
jgi:hypothetical protein